MPHRAPLYQVLYSYRQRWLQEGATGVEIATWERAQRFATAVATCCERSHLAGHFTGSALITNTGMDMVLLTHHAKLNKWLQLGGHADGDPALDAVAMRESEEESGLSQLSFSPELQSPEGPLALDLDIHVIPARGLEPEHEHFDLRFLIVADPSEKLVVSSESHDLRWFTLDAARATSTEPSMWRQFAKLEALRNARLRR